MDVLSWRPEHLRHIVVEFTDVCNLRCIYCHQSLPGFEPRGHVNDAGLAELVEFAKAHNIGSIDLTGGGDLTMAPDWNSRCDMLLDAGVELNVTINLGRILTEAEIDTFSRFNVITVSIDTLDRELLRAVRKSADVRTILSNMARIKAKAHRHGRTKLKWIISGVYYAEITAGLPDLASYAVTFGAGFGLQDLVQYGPLSKNVGTVWMLKGEQAVAAANNTKHAISIARAGGISLHLPGDFESRLSELETQAFVVTAAPKVNIVSSPTKPGISHITYDSGVSAGMTRDCTDPWKYVQVLTDGVVRPCCLSRVTLGRLGHDGSLEEILNSSTARKLRQNLLDGTLDENCRACTARQVIPIDEYRNQMRFRLASSGFSLEDESVGTSAPNDQASLRTISI